MAGERKYNPLLLLIHNIDTNKESMKQNWSFVLRSLLQFLHIYKVFKMVKMTGFNI